MRAAGNVVRDNPVLNLAKFGSSLLRKVKAGPKLVHTSPLHIRHIENKSTLARDNDTSRLRIRHIESASTILKKEPLHPPKESEQVQSTKPAKSTKHSTRAMLARHENTTGETKTKTVVPAHAQLRQITVKATSNTNGISRSISADGITIEDLSQPKRVEPPLLQHGLERALFNPGVARIQCPRTGVFNFHPSIKTIPHVSRFKPNLLPPYLLPSEDPQLRKAFRNNVEDLKYLAATSTSTGALQHMHFLLSNWRPVNTNMLSKGFGPSKTLPTQSHSAPTSIVLKQSGAGQYVINSDFKFEKMDKELMQVGHMLELKLTVSGDEFQKFLEPVENEAENETAEAVKTSEVAEQVTPAPMEHTYNYTRIGSFLVRSQLDARHPRLSTTGGKGYFDIKTRAVLAVRMDPLERHPEARGYNISRQHGEYSSYEREMYDLMRTMLLKYSLQARIGQMDGIFIAHHNLSNVLGFQFLSLHDMDEIMHGQRDDEAIDPYQGLAGQEFKMSFLMLEHVLDLITETLSKQDLWLHFDSVRSSSSELYVFGERVTDELLQEVDETAANIEARSKTRAQTESLEDLMNNRTIMHEQAQRLMPLAEELAELVKKQKEISEDELQSLTPEGLGPLVEQYISLTEEYKRVNSDIKVADLKAPSLVQMMSTIKGVIQSAESFAHQLPGHLQHVAFSEGQKLLKEAPPQKSVFHWDHKPKDLVGFRISIQNHVNDKPVSRPEKLRPQDKWTVQYNIEELTPDKAELAYRPMLQRKMMMKDDDINARLYAGKFFATMQHWSQKGAQWDGKLQQRGKANFDRHLTAKSANYSQPTEGNVEDLQSVVIDGEDIAFLKSKD